MINLTPIPTRIQERMREKMDALGRDTVYYPDSDLPILTQEKMLSRATFSKMVSGQKKPVVLMGGELQSDNDILGGFNEIYGPRMSVTEEMEQSLLRGRPIDAQNPTNRPTPGIKSISARFQGGMAARREATVQWSCWSFEDLSRLMPHFLAHGKTVMIQWGWIYDKEPPPSTFTDGKNRIKADAFTSNHLRDVIDNSGDYDMMTGVIKNFSFTARQDGGFDCETIITSIGINILASTEGTVSSIDPVITYNLS